MAITEKTIQETIQTILQGMVNFSATDVTINDWNILDSSVDDAPFAIIQNADDFQSMKQTVTPTGDWNTRVNIYVKFTDWSTTLNELRDLRQSILDTFNGDNTNRTLATAGVNIPIIRNDGPMQPYFGNYLNPEEILEAMPEFIYQTIIFEVEEF